MNEKSDDCARCCIAELMGLNPMAVPHFVAEHGGQWRTALSDWLRPRNLGLLNVPRDIYWPGKILVCGPTKRGKDHHMVIFHNGTLFYDPHPSGVGLTRIEKQYLLVPLDLAL